MPFCEQESKLFCLLYIEAPDQTWIEKVLDLLKDALETTVEGNIPWN